MTTRTTTPCSAAGSTRKRASTGCWMPGGVSWTSSPQRNWRSSATAAHLRAQTSREGAPPRINQPRLARHVNHESSSPSTDAKMLLHATVYDNNGMVAAEALLRASVVLYDLPAATSTTSVASKSPKAIPDNMRRPCSDARGTGFRRADRPTPEQVADLREHWCWRNRTKIFVEFFSRFQLADQTFSRT